MAFVRQSPSRIGKSAIAYCRDGEFDKFWGKDDGEKSKCLLIDQSRMLPDEVIKFEDQMADCWNHFANNRYKNEVRRLIFSFAPDEIDNRLDEDGEFIDYEAPYKALEITKAFCEKTYPDRQIAYFVQADGKRHAVNDFPKVHVHVIVNDWSLEDGSGVPTKMTDAKWLAHEFTDFARDFVYESGEEFHLTINHDKNMQTLDKNYKPNRYHEKRVKESWFERKIADGDISKFDEDGYYNSYKDYIVDVIKSSYEIITSEDDFRRYLSENGIDVELKESKKKGSFYKYTVRDEFILGRGDNPKVRAPRTNNPSIGDGKLSKWSDVEIGVQAVSKIADANKAANKPGTKIKMWHAEWDNIVETSSRDEAFDEMLKKLEDEKGEIERQESEQISETLPRNVTHLYLPSRAKTDI